MTGTFRPLVAADEHARTWHRLAASAVVPLTLKSAVQTVRQSWQGLAAALASLHFGAGLFETVVGWLLAGGGLVGLFAVSGILRWWYFRFRFDAHGIEVREGILHRRAMRLAFARVQNLRIEQPFYLRPLGLVSLHLDGAGSQGSEVDLAAVPRSLAEGIAERIRERRGGAARSDVPASEEIPPLMGDASRGAVTAPVPASDGEAAAERTILRRDPRALLRHGLASNHVWLFAGALASLLGGFGGERLRVPAGIGAFLKSLPLPPSLLMVLILLLVIVVIFALSALASLLVHYDFRLSRGGDGVWRARGGLIERREDRMPDHKIQALIIRQTAIGRLLGVWEVVFHHAGGTRSGAARVQGMARMRRFLVPGLTAREVAHLVDAVFGAATWDGLEWQAVDRYFIRHHLRYAVALPLLVLMLALLLAAAIAQPVSIEALPWIAGGAAGWALLVGSAITAAWRRAGYARADDLMGVSDGIIGRRFVLFRPFKTQWLRLATSPGQCRHGLASLMITLAGRRPVVPYISRATALRLRDRLLLAAAEDPRPWF